MMANGMALLLAGALALSKAGAQGGSTPQGTPTAEIAAATDPAQAPAQTPAKDDLFDGTEKFAAGARDVTEINMDGKSLGLVGGRRGAESDLARKMDLTTVHTYSYDKPGMFRIEDVEAFRQKLQDKSWNCFLHTRSKDSSTDMCSRTTPDKKTNELVIITVEPKELTFIHTRGRASLADLRRLDGGVGDSDEDAGATRRKAKPESK